MAAYTLNQKLQGEGLCTVAYDSESRNFTIGPITGEESGNTGSGIVSGCSLGHSFANGWVQSVAPDLHRVQGKCKESATFAV